MSWIIQCYNEAPLVSCFIVFHYNESHLQKGGDLPQIDVIFLFKASALWADAFYKSICPSVRVSVHFRVPFKRLFALTAWSRMSNIFRDSESVGKSSGKKWSQIWNFLFGSGLKLPNKKKSFFCWVCLTKHGGNHASRWIRDLWSKGVSLILPYF